MVRCDQHYVEIGHILDARNVSAFKALKRMFRFEMIDGHQTVAHLDRQLKNNYTIYTEKKR